MKPQITTYRLIKDNEGNEAYDLILRVFHEFVAPHYSEHGIATFLDMVSPEFLLEISPAKFTLVAEQDGKLVGVSAIFKANHLGLLFVDGKYQGQGIGRGLIQACIEQCRENHPDVQTMTVSSSPNAVSFYRHFGFETIGEEQSENGLRFIPMAIETG